MWPKANKQKSNNIKGLKCKLQSRMPNWVINNVYSQINKAVRDIGPPKITKNIYQNHKKCLIIKKKGQEESMYIYVCTCYIQVFHMHI